MKRRFTAKEKAIITADIPNEEESRRKGMVPGVIVPEYLKRRLGSSCIQFYDLAQINIGTTETPIWSDHPILKTPSYSVLLSGTNVNYTVEDFGESDYFAFTDSLFDLGPVTEWKNIFRKMRLNPLQTAFPYYEEFPITLTIESPVTSTLKAFMVLMRTPDLSTGQAERLANLTDYGLSWNPRGLEYRNLTKLRLSSVITDYTSAGNVNLEWFPFRTDQSIYKVTATYDPGDTDVMADLTFSGNIEVYLIPMPCLYFVVGALAADYSPDTGFNVMFAYQVLPRQWFPQYADPFELLSNDARTGNFIDYQKTRDGMVASHWHRTAPGVITESAIDPLTFMAGVDSYKGVATNSDSSQFYQSASIRTQSRATGEDRFFVGTDYLIAVIKLHGQFYYVWSVDGEAAFAFADDTNGYRALSDSYPDF